MLKHVILLALLTFGISAYCQIGISGHWIRQSFPDWDDQVQPSVVPNDNVFGSGYQIGLDYRLTPFEARIEVLPSLVYTAQTGAFTSRLASEYDWDLSSIGLHVDLNFYPLDWEGDCNCPTFGKGGSVFDKGFFFSLSPGVDYLTQQGTILTEDGRTITTEESVLQYSFGGGVGLDIGLSEYLTLTPYAGGRYFLPFEFAPFIVDGEPQLNTETSATQFEFGLRLGVHFTN